MSINSELFQSRVAELNSTVRSWVEPEWVSKEYPKKLRDEHGQRYEAQALFLQRGPVRILLDPIAFDAPGSEGLIDLYLMPTYDDLASLYFEDGQWVIHYAFPPSPEESHSVVETQALPLDQAAFQQVLESIAAHAEP